MSTLEKKIGEIVLSAFLGALGTALATKAIERIDKLIFDKEKKDDGNSETTEKTSEEGSQ